MKLNFLISSLHYCLSAFKIEFNVELLIIFTAFSTPIYDHNISCSLKKKRRRRILRESVEVKCENLFLVKWTDKRKRNGTEKTSDFQYLRYIFFSFYIFFFLSWNFFEIESWEKIVFFSQHLLNFLFQNIFLSVTTKNKRMSSWTI